VIECANCHAVLAEGVAKVPATDCPNCGSGAKAIRAGLESSLSFDARSIAHGRAEAEGVTDEAVRISGPRDREAAGDIKSGASTTQDISGRAPRGEEGRLETAILLVQKLCQLGEVWNQPYEVDISDIDCQSVGEDGLLDIQVVRPAMSDMWKTLSRTGHSSQAATVDELADVILEVARKKARLPPDQLGNLVLAIDARDTPVFAMAGTVDGFRGRHINEVARLGFRSVWVVGPTVDFVARLDAT
jgi:hypothetical protein